MRNFLLILTIFAFVFSALGQSNIPDGELEDWKQMSGQGKSFFEPQNDYLQSLNRLTIEIPLTFVLDVPITSERTTDAFSGTFAAKLTSKNATSPGGPIFLPGALTNIAQFLITQQTVRLGRPYNLQEKPQTFDGYFKYEPVNGDSAMSLVLLSKWNNTLKRRDTIAFGRTVITSAIGQYTLVSTPINYRDEVTMPDSITILVCSSAGLNFSNLQTSEGQPGSALYVDQLSFGFQKSLNNLSANKYAISIFPNPTKEFVQINSNIALEGKTLKIINLEGKEIYSEKIISENQFVGLPDLKAGIYFINILESKSLLHSQKIIIE